MDGHVAGVQIAGVFTFRVELLESGREVVEDPQGFVLGESLVGEGTDGVDLDFNR